MVAFVQLIWDKPVTPSLPEHHSQAISWCQREWIRPTHDSIATHIGTTPRNHKSLTSLDHSIFCLQRTGYQVSKRRSDLTTISSPSKSWLSTFGFWNEICDTVVNATWYGDNRGWIKNSWGVDRSFSIKRLDAQIRPWRRVIWIPSCLMPTRAEQNHSEFENVLGPFTHPI